VTGRWFSLGTPVSSTHKSDSHDIAEILLYHNPENGNSQKCTLFYCLKILKTKCEQFVESTTSKLKINYIYRFIYLFIYLRVKVIVRDID
jgi:hypothetical protein